ncbi:MAG: RAMP superfamily CRISPR-associated protein [Candidatus Heimdallarchaeota archaeon]
MKEFNRITVTAQAWFTKTLNGSSGSSSFLMRGGEIPYSFIGKTNVKVVELEEFLELYKDTIFDDYNDLRVKAEGKKQDAKIQVTILKEEKGVSRVVKGVRGAIRHSIMNILHQRNIDYCSPTLKAEFTGTGKPTLLEHEHLMGNCKNNPCPVRQLFGMLGEESPIRVWSDVLIQTDKSLEKITKQNGLSFVYVSTENRHASRRDGKSLQGFSEQYFSGEFRFYIEFSKELPNWLLGLLVDGILGVTNIGRGSNSGYGRLEIKDIAFERIIFERKLGEENGEGKLTIIESEKKANLNDRLNGVLEVWQKQKVN